MGPNVFNYTRFIILLAVIGCFISSVSLLILGTVDMIYIVEKTINSTENLSAYILRKISLAFLEVIDIYLLATIFYIVSIGLYELFIDSKIMVPKWLAIKSMDDLKNKVISGIIMVMSVFFVSKLTTSPTHDINIAYLGFSVSVVIAALTYFLCTKEKKKSE